MTVRSSRLLVAAGLALSVTVPSVQAQSSPYYLGVAQTLTHESNLIRLRDGQAATAGLSGSDTVSSTALVAGVDQRFGRQRLTGSGSLRANRYANNSVFNSQGYSGNLALEWQTVQTLSGTVEGSIDRAQRADLRDRLGRFIADGNLESSQRGSTVVRLGLAGPLSLEAGVNGARVRYSSSEASYAEYTQTGSSLGLRYRLGGATSLALSVRRTDYEYPNLLITQIDPRDKRRRDEVDLSLAWVPSGASRVDLSIGQGRTRYQQLAERNFSGTTGAASWTWQPAGKTRLSLRYGRNSGQNSDYATNAFTQQTDSLRASADYEISAKLAAGLAVQRYHRQLDGNGQFLTGVRGTDNGGSASLNLRWVALRSLTLSCQASRENRGASSNPLLQDKYSASSYGCSGQFVLQ